MSSEFHSWKRQLEDETKSNYVQNTGMRTLGMSQTQYFRCSRTGNYESKASQRLPRVQGSKKIGGKCPAFMRVKHEKDSGRISVVFSNSHVGHIQELKHLNIPPDEREKLAADLSLRIPKNEILLNIRGSTSDRINRLDLVTKKDLRNIGASYNLHSDVKMHGDDFTSISMWIERFQQLPDNPVLIYEPLNESNENFLLAIMNESQRYMLKKYGERVICIDSTHGTNQYDYQLTTLMVIDDNK